MMADGIVSYTELIFEYLPILVIMQTSHSSKGQIKITYTYVHTYTYKKIISYMPIFKFRTHLNLRKCPWVGIRLHNPLAY